MKKALLMATFSLLFSVPATSLEKEVVRVYSSRKEHLVSSLFKAFEKETNIKVDYLTGKDAPLLQRLKTEGKNTSADLLMTVDAGNLYFAEKEGLLQAAKKTDNLLEIPTHLHSPTLSWFALSKRARTIAYNPSLVKKSELESYEGLANSKWKNKLCLRTSKKVYNQSLVAMMIGRLGEKKAAETIQGWVSNLAHPVFSSDTELLKAINAGTCALGIVNTYYLGRMQKKDPFVNIKLFWPSLQNGGVHINISGAGITKHAKNKEKAQTLLNWLSGKKAQELYAGLNLEYPVLPETTLDPIVQAWGDFEEDPTPLYKAGELQIEAIKLMEKNNYK